MSGFVAGAVIGYVAFGTVAAIAVGAVVGYVVGSAIIDMITPDMPDVDSGTQGAMTNKASSNDPIPIIYGERKIGATQVFAETSGSDNKYFHEVLVLGEGEIEGVTDVWVNDDLITSGKYNIGNVAPMATAPTQTQLVATWAGNVDHIFYVEIQCAVSGVHTYSGSGTSGTLESGASAQTISYDESPSGYEDEGWHGDLSASINLTPYDTSVLNDTYEHDVVLVKTRGRGTITLLQHPSFGNDYKAVVKIFDDGGGEDHFQFNLTMREGSEPDTSTGQMGVGRAIAYIHKGTDDQVADANLVSATSNWTASHQLKGTAYAYIRLEYDADVFPSGIPVINFTVKGVKVYDPRTTTTAWSDNPALCIRDYLTNTRYGRGLPTAGIDDTSFIAAANHCDEMVDLTGAGTTVKRYICNGLINTESGSISTLKALVSCCRGILVFTAGKYKLLIDKSESAGFAFDKTNVIGGWNIAMGSKANRYNKISATFTNKERSWRDDIAHSSSSTYKTNDNNLKLEQEMKLPFTTDIERAQVLCALMLNQSRQQIVVSFMATIEALQVEVGEVITITDDGMGWSSKTFRVERLDIKSSSEIKVTVREYDSTVYDFGNVTAQDTIPNTNLPDLTVVGSPSAISTSELLYSTIGGAGVKVRITIDWIVSDDIFVKEYEVEWSETGSVYNHLTVTRRTQAILNDANPVLHNFRVRAINTVGVRSAWAYLRNVTVAGLTTPPVDVGGLSFIALSGSAHLSWDLATDLDVRVGGKVRFRHSNLTTGATWESSTDIGTAVSGHNTNAVLPLISGTYMAKFVDSTGNESVNASSFVSTTVPNIVNMNAVATSTQNPSFTGTKTNMVAVDNVLKFEADTLLDSVTELMDDWELLDAIGGLDSAGSYEFDTYIDLGAVYTSRATASIAFTAFVIGDFIDNRTALMDTWTDFDNAPSDVTLNLYVATTNDDPSGTPTWSSWAKFTVADYSARAYKFKVEASSTNADHQINITELSVAVDMPDTVQGANALTSLSTGLLSVTYATPFKAIPALGVTFTDLDSNDILDIQNETTTGFDVGVKHGSNYEAHNFNYLARGY